MCYCTSRNDQLSMTTSSWNNCQHTDATLMGNAIVSALRDFRYLFDEGRSSPAKL